MEFLCPSCQKLTRVGKKGVSVLQDNFYVLPLSTAVKAEDDDDVNTTVRTDAAMSRLVSVDLT